MRWQCDVSIIEIKIVLIVQLIVTYLLQCGGDR